MDWACWFAFVLGFAACGCASARAPAALAPAAAPAESCRAAAKAAVDPWDEAANAAETCSCARAPFAFREGTTGELAAARAAERRVDAALRGVGLANPPPADCRTPTTGWADDFADRVRRLRAAKSIEAKLALFEDTYALARVFRRPYDGIAALLVATSIARDAELLAADYARRGMTVTAAYTRRAAKAFAQVRPTAEPTKRRDPTAEIDTANLPAAWVRDLIVEVLPCVDPGRDPMLVRAVDEAYSAVFRYLPTPDIRPDYQPRCADRVERVELRTASSIDTTRRRVPALRREPSAPGLAVGVREFAECSIGELHRSNEASGQSRASATGPDVDPPWWSAKVAALQKSAQEITMRLATADKATRFSLRRACDALNEAFEDLRLIHRFPTYEDAYVDEEIAQVEITIDGTHLGRDGEKIGQARTLSLKPKGPEEPRAQWLLREMPRSIAFFLEHWLESRMRENLEKRTAARLRQGGMKGEDAEEEVAVDLTPPPRRPRRTSCRRGAFRTYTDPVEF